jgi:hypothetical protein
MSGPESSANRKHQNARVENFDSGQSAIATRARIRQHRRVKVAKLRGSDEADLSLAFE